MRRETRIGVVIPALDEERALPKVLGALPDWIDELIVVDNGSSDRTAEVARASGARVVVEPRRGYGAACRAGIAALDRPGVVVFLDADASDDPSEIGRLVDPILLEGADLVIGSRVLGDAEPGALTPVQRAGNRLACALIHAFWGVRYTDLGPFRAIKRSALERLKMADQGFGWTVEMQVKAARAGLAVTEVPTRYRRRIGVSKISGTVSGTVRAGAKILYVIFRSLLSPKNSRAGRPGENARGR
ncbi:MAG: glycosyltransferase family 2 protein [Proteobacteria bacterium]|nr:glycosyltransferase family 2 protein [Pseudomonadota bacterium]